MQHNGNEKVNTIIKIFTELYKYVLDEFKIDISEEELNGLISFTKGEKQNISKKRTTEEIEIDKDLTGCFYISSFPDEEIKDIIAIQIYRLFISQYQNYLEIKHKHSDILESIKNNVIKYIDQITFHYSLNDIITLSNMGYEKGICKGSICYCDKNNESAKIRKLIPIDCKKEHRIYFSSENLKIIRKLLETTSEEISLLIKKDDAYSKGSKYYIDSISAVNESDLKILFLGKSHFKILKNNSLLIEYNDGKYFIKDRLEISIDEIKIIKDFFANSSNSKTFVDFLYDISQLGEAFHGTVVIATNDTDFIDRMNNHYRSINVFDESSKLCLFDIYNKSLADIKEALIKLSCVDGAIVVDLNGCIRAFGVILDGHSCSEGDRSRGARFNSTKTFIEDYSINNINKKYLGVVMSEDGPINIFSSDEIRKKLLNKSPNTYT